MLIIHNSTCIPPTLVAIVPTAGPGQALSSPIYLPRKIPSKFIRNQQGSVVLNGEYITRYSRVCWPVPG